MKIQEEERDELRRRLKDKEDNFTERKSEGVSSEDIAATLIAFANSLPLDSSAVLFIGVNNNGKITGLANSEKLQGTVMNICKYKIFPAISEIRMGILNEPEGEVLAIKVLPSKDRPHVSGKSFVRRGNMTYNASEEEFRRIIVSRLEKTKPIIDNLNQSVTVRPYIRWPGSSEIVFADRTCEIKNCTAFQVDFYDNSSGGSNFSVPLNNVEPSHDIVKNRLMLIMHFNEVPRADFVADYFKRLENRFIQIETAIMELYPQPNNASWGGPAKRLQLIGYFNEIRSALNEVPELKKHKMFYEVDGQLGALIQWINSNAPSFDKANLAISKIFEDLKTIVRDFRQLF